MSLRRERLKFVAVTIAAGASFWAGCNENPVSFKSQSGILDYEETVNVSGSEQIDILWVVDNSGSMCQEQKILGDNFDAFINELDGTTLDFHLSVTTTHMIDNYLPEPVARPGYLQSTPQPVPGFDPTCRFAVDENGETITGDYTPIRDAIATAVSCMANPDPGAFSWTDAEIECALNGTPGCTLGGDDCGGGCGSEDLFPDPSQYRAIPKVIRSEEYREADGTLDIAGLQADFRCMSLVGTRGYGIEKGLEAAVVSMSPELTGGPLDPPEDGSIIPNTEAPNHGFLRRTSKFALIFVTDENDCTHDGSLDEATSCGGDVCEYYNSTQLGEGESPLIAPPALKEQLLTNLRESKGNPNLGEAELLVASIHGRSRRYEGPVVTPDQCSADGYEPPPFACASALGRANSGDRYERFIREFPQYYPTPDPNDIVQGWMCSETFAPALQAIGEFIKPLPSGCVQRNVFPCDGADAVCPNFVTGDPGQCTAFPNREGTFYCNSGIQVRAQLSNPTPDEQQRLLDTGYCIEGTFGLPDYPNGCIIRTDLYQWGECAPGVPGIRLQWNDETAVLNNLQGTEIGIRYAAEIGED
jgi:hypothetical protein